MLLRLLLDIIVAIGVKGGMEAPDIRRKLEDDENKYKKTSNDDSLGMWSWRSESVSSRHHHHHHHHRR